MHGKYQVRMMRAGLSKTYGRSITDEAAPLECHHRLSQAVNSPGRPTLWPLEIQSSVSMSCYV